MKTSSRLVAVLLAAIVWIYAGMSVAPGPIAHQAVTPSVLDAAACLVRAVAD